MSKVLRAIAIDDEQDSLDILLDHLSKIPEIRLLETYTDPSAGIDGIVNYKPDLLFLDIQMPGIDGFEVVSKIRSFDIHPTIIFITGFDKFALKAIKHAAFDYLIKPVDAIELQETIDKLKTANQVDISGQLDKLLNHINTNVKLKFNTRTGFIIIDTSEIIYCLADRNYSEIFLSDGRKEVVTCNLKNLYTQLEKESFFRAHRSLLINLNFLVKVDRTKRKLTLKNQSEHFEFTIPSKQLQQLKIL